MKDRHIKSKRMESWTDLRTEIKSISESLQIPGDKFSEVNINSWSDIQNKIWTSFSDDNKTGWIWENLKVPNKSIRIDSADIHMDDLITNQEKVGS